MVSKPSVDWCVERFLIVHPFWSLDKASLKNKGAFSRIVESSNIKFLNTFDSVRRPVDSLKHAYHDSDTPPA
jgi:hypothetical protein